MAFKKYRIDTKDKEMVREISKLTRNINRRLTNISNKLPMDLLQKNLSSLGFSIKQTKKGYSLNVSTRDKVGKELTKMYKKLVNLNEKGYTTVKGYTEYEQRFGESLRSLESYYSHLTEEEFEEFENKMWEIYGKLSDINPEIAKLYDSKQLQIDIQEMSAMGMNEKEVMHQILQRMTEIDQDNAQEYMKHINNITLS